MIRLQKYLAECGVASRRAAEDFIQAGRVEVNGQTAAIGCGVDPETDAVTIDGQPVILREEKIYVILNKPANTVTTAQDNFGRRTVLECIKGVKARVFPVGRLDMDVEGALLLTNDGELAHRLMHPRYQVRKVYLAKVMGLMTEATATRLAKGVRLEDGMTAPAKVAILNAGPGATQVRLVLCEGRKREVKRMCATVGHPVKRLERLSFAGIGVQDLRPGEWRYLNSCEVAALRALAGFEEEEPAPRS